MANPKRAMATIRHIDSIDPIEGADRIEVARVGGWSVVVGKGEYNAGDYAVYFEVDTFLPSDDEHFAFLAPRGTRKMVWNGEEREGHVLRTAKMRGVYSQGLLMSPDLWGINPDALLSLCARRIDLSELLGVWEWYKPLPSADFIGRYDPYVAPRTGAARVQNVDQESFDLLKKTEYYVSVKIDGTSMTICKDIRDGEIKIFSHNNRLKLDTGIGLVTFNAANSQGIVDLCEHNPGITIQYELAGEKINGNRLDINGHRCFVFSAYDMMKREYIDPYKLASNLDSRGLRQSLTPKIYLDLGNFDTPTDLLKYADAMHSYVAKGRLDEGLVVHCVGRGEWSEEEWPSIEMQLRDVLGVTMQLKVVSNKYLLKAKN